MPTKTVRIVLKNVVELEIDSSEDKLSHWSKAQLLALAKNAFMQQPHSTFINEGKYKIKE
jgi:hypothetical protein